MKRFNLDKKQDVRLSKNLSWLLRHGAVKEGIPISQGGYVNVSDILKHKNFKTAAIDDIKRVVDTNDKQRFHLRKTESGELEIRANQGHTLLVDELDLTPICKNDEIEHVIHGTYRQFWESIQSQGLSRCKRNHIHFSCGLPNDKNVISGMRRDCDVFIYIDLQRALNDGLLFYKSKNNVILSPGNSEGFIEPKYFMKIEKVYK